MRSSSAVNIRTTSILHFFVALVLFCPVHVIGFNISNILQKYGRYSRFHQRLSETKLTDEINHLRPVTVFAIDNYGMRNFEEMVPKDAWKEQLSLHIGLKYFDTAMSENMKINETYEIPTLYKIGNGSNPTQKKICLTRTGEYSSVSVHIENQKPEHSITPVDLLALPKNISVVPVSAAILDDYYYEDNDKRVKAHKRKHEEYSNPPIEAEKPSELSRNSNQVTKSHPPSELPSITHSDSKPLTNNSRPHETRGIFWVLFNLFVVALTSFSRFY